MKKVTLNEFLEKLENKEELIYLCTEKGSNFIVIETAQTLIERMDDVEKLIRNKVDRIYKENYERALAFPHEISTTIKELSSSDSTNERKVKNKLRSLESRYVSAIKVRDQYGAALDAWKYVGDRVIKGIDERTVYDPGTIVRIEGFESGSLWNRGERKTI